VELLERLQQGKIKAQTRTNLVQEKKYSDRLIEALRKYQTWHSFRVGWATRILRVCVGKMWQHCARITFILVRAPNSSPWRISVDFCQRCCCY